MDPPISEAADTEGSIAMKTTITTGTFLAAALVMTMQVLTGCAQTAKSQTNRELRGRGMVVEFGLARGANPKEGVGAVSDAGNDLYSSNIYKQGIRHELAVV